MQTNVTLEQWQTLIAIVEHGGYAAAAEAMGKGQSTLSYSISQLENKLQVRVFTLKGRKASLTPAGRALYQRAKRLVEEAKLIEELAAAYSEGRQTSIRVAADILFPQHLTLKTIEQFTQSYPQTRIELHETILSGTHEAILKRNTDLVLTGYIPFGTNGTPLIDIERVAVAHKDHPLHNYPSPLEDHHLTQHRQIVLRDSGSKDIDAGWLQSQQRITVTHLQTSIEIIKARLGFAWLPKHCIQAELESGLLKPLTLQNYQYSVITLFMVYPNADYVSPAVQHFSELLQAQVALNQPATNPKA